MIGVFDSGIGGLTVVKEIFRQLPGYSVVYFGDTARTPYGNKSPKTVVRYSLQDAEFLVSKGAKVIVVACNTASALAIATLRRKLKVPLFEVVAPAVERAAAVTRGRVGVIGTRATVESGIYAEKMRLARPRTKVYGQACPLFVPLVEEGWLQEPETRMVVAKYIAPLRKRGIDSLILGCTHYPFLRPLIAKELPDVRLVDPARETAAALKEYLSAHPELDRRMDQRGRRKFFVSDRTGHFSHLAADWLGGPIDLQEVKLE
ncbi:MAG: glutamate racemase [Patescibacteria group bacterium]|jgi:glutamate racemase